jgi:hypothetical protein
MTDDTNRIDQMTQEALDILMRISPQHARHIEIKLQERCKECSKFHSNLSLIP